MGFFFNRQSHISGARVCLYSIIFFLLPFFLLPDQVWATQDHSHSEGIIVHQAGHVFFLFSMLVLMFTVTDKGLNRQKGWRMIQISAFFFALWNLDAIAAHFLDNQLRVVRIIPESMGKMEFITVSESSLLAASYYLLKLDHLLCVPAMLMLYLGISRMVEEQQANSRNEEP